MMGPMGLTCLMGLITPMGLMLSPYSVLMLSMGLLVATRQL